MPRMKPTGPTAGPKANLYQGTVSLGHLAKLWHLPRRAVRRLVQQGRLPFVQIAGKIRVPKEHAQRPKD